MRFTVALQEIIESYSAQGIVMGLDRIMQVLDRMNFQFTIPSIHVAGTNGKGSTCHFIENILLRQGYKVAVYSSPHLTDFYERFRINGRNADDNSMSKSFDFLLPFLRKQELTYFEIITIWAFVFFREQKPDIAIIETGMGGRLDATNIITPLLSVITPIGLDHQEFLGQTITQIAYEKAGIIKHKIPVVSGYQLDEAREVLESVAQQKDSCLLLYQRDFFLTKKKQEYSYSLYNYRSLCFHDEFELTIRDFPQYQHTNIATSLESILFLRKHGFEISLSSIEKGINDYHLPGRFEKFFTPSKNVLILDGAHNEHGFSQLYPAIINEMKTTETSLTVIVSVLARKNIGLSFYNLLRRAEERYYYQQEDNICHDFAHSDCNRLESLMDVEQKVQNFWNEHSQNKILLLSGSLYFLGKIRPFICHLAGQSSNMISS